MPEMSQNFIDFLHNSPIFDFWRAFHLCSFPPIVLGENSASLIFLGLRLFSKIFIPANFSAYPSNFHCLIWRTLVCFETLLSAHFAGFPCLKLLALITTENSQTIVGGTGEKYDWNESVQVAVVIPTCFIPKKNVPINGGVDEESWSVRDVENDAEESWKGGMP